MKYLAILAIVVLTCINFKAPLVKAVASLPISSELFGPVKGVTTGKDEANFSNATYHTVFPAHDVTFRCTDKQFHVQESSVTILHDARIAHKSGLVISSRDLLLSDNANDWSKKNIHEVNLLNRWHIPSVQKTYDETVAVLTTKGAECYYHWMFEALPKLHMMQKAGVSFDKLYITQFEQPFQKRTLALLGISDDQLIQGTRSTMIKARTVIVPSRPGQTAWAQNVPEPWVIDFLRTTFLKESPAPTKRIYISRSQAKRRRLLNEETALVLLQKYGFTSVHLENMPVEEQAALFASATHIVAPHGAALTNLVFASPGCQVIEFFHPGHLITCYEVLAEVMHIPHSSLLLKDEGGCLDGTIDIAELEKVLQKATA